MPSPIPANVTPSLLSWARRESGLSAETVARRVAVNVARIEAWEQGERKPSVRQVMKLARVYRRPFGLFFLAQPPAVEPLAAEYRRLPGVTPGEESPEFRLAVRVMLQRREVALELGAASFPAFSLSARTSESPEVVGRRLRDGLGIAIETQRAWKNEWVAWREWRAAVEAIGVLVFQFPKVPLTEARGLALLLDPLPAIGINSKESAPGARIFTLVHELVHLALGRAREEAVALRERRSDDEWMAVERFAEEAASHAIIPEAALREELSAHRSRDWDVAQVRTLARRFRVTPRAMATRLRSAGVMTWDRYRRWLAEWDVVVAAMPPRHGGIATPVDKAIGRAGRPFTQLVLEALDTNQISAVDASHFLDLRFDHFHALRSELRNNPMPLSNRASSAL
jgi:Zn-dependent peptidase ImmA (M78 family)/DNA-binding XRE family transcriptional regulator